MDGGAIDRVLDIPIDETPDIEFDQLLVRPANSVVTVEGLTLRNGSPPDVGPFFPFIFPGLGGAARNAGTLTMTDVTLRDSVATDAGGLRNDGTVTLDRVTVRDNRSLTFGGGVLNNGTATLRNVTVSGNTAATADGGVLNFASTVPNAMTVINSTITGNGAPNGANLTNAGDAPLTGGVMGQLTIRNSLVANPLDASGNPVSNCPAVSAGAGVITSGGGNLEFPGESCGFNQASDVRADPQVGALADNGGATDTRALPPVSPALNRAVAANCPTVDQRAIARPQGPGCDIGAFELERPQLVLAKTGPASAPTGEEVEYVVTAGRAGAGPTGAVTLTDDLPDDAVFVSATPSAGTCGTPQGAGLVLTCSLGDVAGGAAPITVRVRVRLTAPGTATNRASLAAVNADAVTAMAQTDVASPPPANVTPARLALSKTGPARVNAGAVATYQLTVANRSSVTASKVIVTDQLPRGARLVSVRSRGVACTKPVPTCAFGDLAPGASAAVTIRARLLSAGTRTDVARATATNAAAVQDAATTRVNGVPVAVRDRYRTRENRRLRILPQGVLRNDRDTEGAAHLRVTGGIAGGAVVSLSRAVRTFRTRHGSVRLGSDGAFTYTPRRGFTGVDAFSYRATDGRATSAAARVTIVVVGVPRPRFTG